MYRLATELGLDGWVANDADGVVIEVSGPTALLDVFVGRLRSSAPPLSQVISVVVTDLGDRCPSFEAGGGERGFSIRSSAQATADLTTLVPADVRPCDACRRELRDPTDRRFRHAFINCTDCGPRFTIIRSLPYDRANTTMSGFALCAACNDEYHDPASRRFHAEPLSCRDCGPRLHYRTLSSNQLGDPADFAGTSTVHPDDRAMAQAVAAIRAGLIVAVKGIGGYAFVVDAGNDTAVQALRVRKHRDEKPFALQVASIEMGRTVVELTESETEALLSNNAPIVLARRFVSDSHRVSSSVAPGSDTLGVMLPSSGLHHLLAASFDGPLIVTSGNLSDEPIVIDDDLASRRLTGIADAILTHDRAIHRRADDSIIRRVGPTLTVLRRARGYVPQPHRLPDSIAGGPTVLGVGAELKSTVCLARGPYAFVSTHLGDLQHVEAFRSFREAIADYQMFLKAEPSLVVHDMHPEYLSTKWAGDQDADTLGVQHHHAHVASCLVENGMDGPALGLAFDGHGYGPDGTLWGGEFLVADLVSYDRVGHFSTVPLPGGTAAIRDPWRMAVSYLTAAYDGDVPRDLPVVSRQASRWGEVEHLVRLPSTMRTSSVGRLFDAASAILGIRDRSSFEGQAAMALEQRAWVAARSDNRMNGSRARLGLHGMVPIEVVDDGGIMRLEPFAFIRSFSESVAEGGAGLDVDVLAWIVHRFIADAAVQASEKICARTNIATIVLSGGVFQNAMLLGMIREDLEALGARVITHRTVPPNDGGISLGQIAIGRAHSLSR